jgi:hypothetical protein
MVLLAALRVARPDVARATRSSSISPPAQRGEVFHRRVERGDAETAKSAAYAGGVEVEWVEAMSSAVSGMQHAARRLRA